MWILNKCGDTPHTPKRCSGVKFQMRLNDITQINLIGDVILFLLRGLPARPEALLRVQCKMGFNIEP